VLKSGSDRQKLWLRRQDGERVWNNGDFRGKSAEEFAVGLNIDSRLRRTWGGRLQIAADGFAGVDEIDPGDSPMAAKECTGDVRKISEAAGGAAEDETNITAIQRSAGSKFIEHSAEMADANAEKFCEFGALGMIGTGFGVLHLKARHDIGEPEAPGLGVIGGHAQALLGSGLKLVEKVSVHSDSGRNDEKTNAGVALEIAVLNPTERDTARIGVESGLGGSGDVRRQSEVVGQRVCRAHRQNREGDRAIRQDLNDVVDGAVAAAGENGIASGEYGLASHFFGMRAGMSQDQAGFHPGMAQQGKDGLQFRLAPVAASAGIRVVEQGCLAHGGSKMDCTLSLFGLIFSHRVDQMREADAHHFLPDQHAVLFRDAA